MDLGGFRPIDLETLDRRAALQRRRDLKYLLDAQALASLLAALRDDHDALEVEGRRVARYETVYFDTPGHRCFHDHVNGELPRFKVRSRLYVDTGVCSLEVKVKQDDGETVKEHLDHAAADHGSLTPDARSFVDEVLRRCTGSAAPSSLAPSLVTRFGRGTLAARDGSERVTLDHDLRLVVPSGAEARLAAGLTLVESKSEDGEGRCDRLLRDAGVEDVGLSKYRTGIALLAEDPDEAGESADSFERVREPA